MLHFDFLLDFRWLTSWEENFSARTACAIWRHRDATKTRLYTTRLDWTFSFSETRKRRNNEKVFVCSKQQPAFKKTTLTTFTSSCKTVEKNYQVRPDLYAVGQPQTTPSWDAIRSVECRKDSIWSKGIVLKNLFLVVFFGIFLETRLAHFH